MTAIAKSASVNSQSVEPTVLARLFGVLAGVARRVLDAAKHRKDMALLAHADDRMLADIGLTRGDLRDALAGRAWEDPTVLLRARALERRLGRCGVGHGFPPSGALHITAPSIAPADGFRRPSTSRPAHLPI